MEVHHHPHIESTHGGKRFKHYLFEFFMLFLAVFAGFLAENFREQQVEKQRGKQYIHSFYEDMKTDTVNFSEVIKLDEIKLDAFTNIFNCYDTIRKNWRSTSCLIPLVKNSHDNFTFVFSDGTLQQLKNAGGYRTLNTDDRDSIMNFDRTVQNYRNYESTYYQETQDMLRNTFSMISDFESNKFLTPYIAGADSSRSETPLLFSDNKALLNKYFNDLLRYKDVTIGQYFLLKDLLEQAKILMSYFKKKYHLK